VLPSCAQAGRDAKLATPIAPLSKARRFIKSLVMEHSFKRFLRV
jgi:hypothetical protein